MKYFTLTLILVSLITINAMDCPKGLDFDPILKVCVNSTNIGWCKPSGGWLLGTCDQCVRCGSNFTCAGASDTCVSDINCGDWNHTCGGAVPVPPTPVKHNCTANQAWNGTVCVNEVGWCQPKGSWMYDSCADCVACPAEGSCPDDQQCVVSMNCKDWDTQCAVKKGFFQKFLDWL